MEKYLSVIMVSYNSLRFIGKCLESVFSLKFESSFQVIVVDNGSLDGTVKLIRANFPSVKVIQNETNLGFSRACNQGLKIAKSKYVLFLNPDTILKHDTLSICIDFIHSNPRIGLLACKLVNADGSLQPSCADFPYIHNLILNHTLSWKIFPDAIGEKLLLSYWNHNKIREVDWVLGAFMLARLDLLKQMKGFDEDFFLYGEDLDLCYRIQQAGWKVIYFPYSEVVHIGNPVWDDQRLERVYNALLKFYSKHFSLPALRLLKCFITLVLRSRGVAFKQGKVI